MPRKPEAAVEAGAAEPLLQARDLRTYFPLRGTFLDRLLGRESGWIKAVDGVSFELARGETLGLVGESGSGKSTLGRTVLGLAGATGGDIRFEGVPLAGQREARLRALRRRMQLVFQDPHASLNPAMDIGTAVGHPLRIHGLAGDWATARARAAEALERVGLTPAEAFLDKYPGELSGGQKQRAVLARAIILNPALLVLDEPVSMLDMSVRAKILELLLRLKREFALTYLYITHDLATAKFFCDRVAIMYLGRIVEIGPPEAIFAAPKHPYTEALLKAIPEPDPQRPVPRDLPRGEVPDAANRPGGCAFHPRCPRAFEVCGWEGRDLRELLERRWTGMDETQFAQERAMIGELDAFTRAGQAVLVPAGKSCSGEAVADFLKQIRAEDPDDPFWRGVLAIEPDGHAALVRLQEGVDPALRQHGQVQVACHLRDPRFGGGEDS